MKRRITCRIAIMAKLNYGIINCVRPVDIGQHKFMLGPSESQYLRHWREGKRLVRMKNQRQKLHI